MEQVETATPPVHDDGPDTETREITGGEISRVGIGSRLQDEYERIARELAAKHTRIPIAVPTSQLVNATLRLMADVPRVPDYDHDLAMRREWTETAEYSPIAVPDHDPHAIGVHADGGSVVLRVDLGETDDDVRLDADYAEALFLAGLAAVQHAKATRDAAVRESSGKLIIPAGVDLS